VATPAARRAAWLIAIAADAMQIALFPMFAGGAVSFVNDGLDLVVAFVLTMLLGWHIAFLPALVTELIPGVDLVPTWTAAVFFATRGMRKSDAVPPTT
jgi:hypothetical protein